MNDLVFFLLAFLTIGPGLVEVHICLRQINVYLDSKEVPEKLSKHLTIDRFMLIRDDACHEELARILGILINKMFVTSLELCLGLIPTIWTWSEEIASNSTFLRDSEVIVGIYFTIILIFYDSIKTFIWEYVVDLIRQYYYFNSFVCNLTILCKNTLCFFFQLMIFIPVSVTVTLVSQNAGDYFFLWLWLYFCLILSIGVTVAWPICILAAIYQLEPLPNGAIRTRIEAVARSFKFPPMEILIAKRSLFSIDKSITTFAGILCIQRIIISDDFISSAHLHDRIHMASSFITDEEAFTLEQVNRNPSSSKAPKLSNENIGKVANTRTPVQIADEISHITLRPTVFKSRISYLRRSRRYTTGAPLIFFTDKNIEALIIHELGHWKHSHNIKKLLMVMVLMLFWFALLGLIIDCPSIYEAVGFEKDKTPCLPGCVIFTCYISGFFCMGGKLIYNLLCTYHEFEADTVIIEKEYNLQMADLLVKRYIKNYKFPIFDVWYRRFYKRYPTLLQRLEFLDNNSANNSNSLVWWYHLT